MNPSITARTSRASVAFDDYARAACGGPLRAESLDTIQVNVGLVCNLSCEHCHVESSPQRKERMSWKTMLAVLALAQRSGTRGIDITGGAPEMHPQIREFVDEASGRGLALIVRTNLTVLLRAGFRDLPGFFAARRVRLIASLPCYREENVDRQRGDRVFHESVDALRLLNSHGYGVRDELELDLVFNPLGPTLPSPQPALEKEYREHLWGRYGVAFTRLLTLTNMPIGRFLDAIRETGQAARYQALLREHARPEIVDRVMCRRQIHVSHDGTLHDCDFNYALRLGLKDELASSVETAEVKELRLRRISTGEHCFACVAGDGSSCGGALR